MGVIWGGKKMSELWAKKPRKSHVGYKSRHQAILWARRALGDKAIQNVAYTIYYDKELDQYFWVECFAGRFK